MSKKTTEPTEPLDHDAIIAEGIQIGLDWIAEREGTTIQWSTPNVATMRSAARIDVSRALAPPPLQLPRPPLVNAAPETSPPARTRDQVDRGYR
jgi:hypothetical protein